MIRELSFKPDFAKTVQRFEAWWNGEIIDRPPVTLRVTGNSKPFRGPTKQHASRREQALDVEFTVEQAVAWMETATFHADTLPVFNPDLGPEITATVFGVELEYGPSTSWSTPIIHSPDGWEKFLTTEPDFQNPYWHKVEQLTDYALQISQGRFLVGLTDLHGNFDILAALRDPQELCLDIVDCPELIRKADRHAAQSYVAMFNRQWARIKAAGMGSTCWAGTYHEGASYVPSSDFWCMVSDQYAREVVLPDLLLEIEPLERSLFHLDGPQALRHLDLLLYHMPKLNAVQWTFGAGKGPASKWMDVYKRCVAAGKGIQVCAADPADALAVLREVGPKGVMLCVSKGFDSVASADAFLKEVERASLGR